MPSLVIVRLCSFIPSAWIFFATVPLIGALKIEFEGDDRGFTPYPADALRFRSAQEFWVDFNRRSVTHYRDTGTTTARTTWINGRVTYHSAKVSSTCLTYSNETWGDGYVSFRAKSTCANPLVPVAPAADYEFTITVWNTGRVRVRGTHDGFPAYEIYKRIGNVFTPIYLFDPAQYGQTVASLAPPMEFSMDKTV